MTRNVLEVSDLKTYFFTRSGIVKAVDGVSFSIGEGETVGFVGESGSGKTMTALSILRLVPQPAGRIVSGKVILDGEDLLQKSERDMRKIRGRKVSMILQDPMSSLNPVFTIGNQVGETFRIHQRIRGSAVAAKVRESLRLVRIPSPEVRMRDFPHQMSGGMRQRVVGAIALSCQPQLLIADEPTTSLDVTIQAQYLRLLKELQQELHTALMFITHDFGIVAKMCDRVMVMYAGKIVESADVRELFNNPSHPYALSLLGCLPRLEARLDKLLTIEGQPPSLLNPPPGCHFAPRCSQTLEICRLEAPPIVFLDKEHSVQCWQRKGTLAAGG